MTEIRRKEDPVIERMLVLNAAHLPFEDSRQFDEKEPPVMLAQFPYGWIVWNDEKSTEGTFLSPAFLRVLQYAKEHNCTKVCFDTDAPLIEGMPTYEWGPFNIYLSLFKEIYRATLVKDDTGPALDNIQEICLKALSALGYRNQKDHGMCLKCGGGECGERCTHS